MEKEIRKIIWTLPAKNELQNIYNFLSEISEIIAYKQIGRIVNQVEHLQTHFITIGQKEPLLINKIYKYHYLIRDNYKIIYRFTKDEVIINRVFDSRQNPRKLKQYLK